MLEPGFCCHLAHWPVHDVQVSDLRVESSPFAPSDLLSTFPHPDLCCGRLTCMNSIKNSPSWASLGSASGDMGRRVGRCREKGQNNNSSSFLLLSHFGKDTVLCQRSQSLSDTLSFSHSSHWCWWPSLLLGRLAPVALWLALDVLLRPSLVDLAHTLWIFN